MRLIGQMLHRYVAVTSFAVIGVLATVTYAVLALLGERLLPAWPAAVVSLIAYIIAGGVSYLGHRRFTYRSSQEHRVAVPRFVLLFIVGNAVAFILPLLLKDWAGFPSWVAIAATCITIPLLNAVVLSFYVFADPEKTS